MTNGNQFWPKNPKPLHKDRPVTAVTHRNSGKESMPSKSTGDVTASKSFLKVLEPSTDNRHPEQNASVSVSHKRTRSDASQTPKTVHPAKRSTAEKSIDAATPETDDIPNFGPSPADATVQPPHATTSNSKTDAGGEPKIDFVQSTEHAPVSNVEDEQKKSHDKLLHQANNLKGLNEVLAFLERPEKERHTMELRYLLESRLAIKTCFTHFQLSGQDTDLQRPLCTRLFGETAPNGGKPLGIAAVECGIISSSFIAKTNTEISWLLMSWLRIRGAFLEYIMSTNRPELLRVKAEEFDIKQGPAKDCPAIIQSFEYGYATVQDCLDQFNAAE